jgi:hypothetical protein
LNEILIKPKYDGRLGHRSIEGIFSIVNLFIFNILIIIVPKFFFADLTLLVAPVLLTRPIMLSRHMHWRDNTFHVKQRFRREKPCRAILVA